jgi:hypothetical protein
LDGDRLERRLYGARLCDSDPDTASPDSRIKLRVNPMAAVRWCSNDKSLSRHIEAEAEAG